VYVPVVIACDSQTFDEQMPVLWSTFVYDSRLEISFAPDLLFASVVVVGHSKSRPDLYVWFEEKQRSGLSTSGDPPSVWMSGLNSMIHISIEQEQNRWFLTL